MLPEDEMKILTILTEQFETFKKGNSFTSPMYMLGLLEIPICMKKNNKQLKKLIADILKYLITEGKGEGKNDRKSYEHLPNL